MLKYNFIICFRSFEETRFNDDNLSKYDTSLKDLQKKHSKVINYLNLKFYQLIKLFAEFKVN
jgi:hypothetical protein